MSGFPSPQSFPSDDETLSPPQIPSSLKSDQKKLKSQTFLYPIDETDDFYDPFSDLSLFLSNKIKKEIQEAGTSKKWSGKIEANLLAKILPEFKKHFPKYRLGATALKKVWEKVSYYYDKIQHHTGAITEEGKLNLPLMIRENLKTKAPQASPLNLPPYHQAHQIAVKISECIATLEGRRPDLDQLTKMIWAVQKNTMRELSPHAAKSPYEDYDKLDKLIVKTALEVCSQYPQIDLNVLKMQILKRLETYGAIQSLVKKNQLRSSLSMLLASKLCPTTLLAVKLSIPEKQALEKFIDLQLEYSEQNEVFSFDTHCQELVERILALYPLAKELPRDLSEVGVREVIRSICLSQGPLPLDSALYVFINAEMHLMKDDKMFEDLQDLEDRLVDAYDLSLSLPELNQELFEVFELLIWKKLSEKKGFLAEIPSQTLEVLERELGNSMIDQPHKSFRTIVRQTLQFFKKVQELPFHNTQDKEFWLTVKKKSEIWALQNEMLCRWIHFDDQTPLLSFLKQEWKSKLSLSKILGKTLKKFPILASFEDQLRSRLWILEQYFWYAELSDGSESSYDRFLKKQYLNLQNAYPECTQRELLEKLKAISHEMLPLIPFEEIAL
ncbi:hypothetical protein [Simkania negevensis]|uniref:Uncharacterized protein n=1 Tax=Simkania negevensis (strain ATCC VR-1471 / DSM 27360 / Z) TaxID=331113 RepID=F8L7J2_SIMNZ|nr:hypothetical protein [Simkania negevensis]CCB88725.1 unknown protein [Simkania negevensis Z]